MKNYFLLLLTIVVLSFQSCGTDPPPIKEGVIAGSQRIEVKRQKYKVVVFGDKSGSVRGEGIPLLESVDLAPLLKAVELGGGELSVGLIGHRSKSDLKRFRPKSKLEFPEQKPGESAADYSQRMERFEQKLADSKFDKDDTSERVAKFQKELQDFLDYSSLESSDISGAVEIAELIMSERDDELADAKKYMLFITDGENYSNTDAKFPASISAPMIVVNTKSSAADLDQYDPVIQTTIEGALRIILND